MPAHGKHRRPKTRSISRGLALASTGGAALALPLVATAAAHATPASAPATVTEKAVVNTAEKIKKAIPAAQGSARTTYTVVSGDSLSAIAQEQRVQGGWKALYRANRSVVGDNPSLIHPGLELTIRPQSATPPKSKAKTKSSTNTGTTDRASRSQQRSSAPAQAAPTQARPAAAPASAPAAPAAAKSYTNDLDGWIRESLDVMAQYGIPGSYDGIHRNIMRESSGNPQAINLWDSNAVKGTPSKGLLQVIEPTFLAYHVPGTSMDLFDPVANITAACNYAADRYGSIDNVNGPY
ncbi:LysM peptidoglycan-binding domain-containing protein [Streptomyces sp. ISL-36]|uniref:LysM peptidoglycan-binding domain-containing protein n=1 Tax=Streptomyces sp. ISL-36 TaxID=2819182 RepID=UPI001BE8BE9C|nr:LysM peptidoglycan-binding domain-containing protein [Streptomyces sp. ISL-36]MBT2443220.1 LysM peptidoglycan-binding domain-containing protein [Streptomyces sp. ISL-36]